MASEICSLLKIYNPYLRLPMYFSLYRFTKCVVNESGYDGEDEATLSDDRNQGNLGDTLDCV